MIFDQNKCFGCKRPLNFVQAKKGAKGLPFDPNPSVPLAVRDDKGRNCWVHIKCWDKAQYFLKDYKT